MRVFAWLGAGFVVWVVVLTFALSSALGGGDGHADSAPGSFSDNTDIGLDADQLRNATISLTEADDLKAPALAVLAMITAALGESNLRVVSNKKGSGYCGVFQADPDNIACEDTKHQARSFQRGGLGFQAGGAIHLARTQPNLTPGTIATMVEASGQAGSWYDVNPNGGAAKAARIIAAWRSGGTPQSAVEVTDVKDLLTPKEVIDRLVLPMAREVGIRITAREVEEANARHSVETTSGSVSEHKGPPDVAWAADISDNWVTTVGSPKMTKLAGVLAKAFEIPWPGSGLVNHDQYVGPCNFRFQMIYLTMIGGDHRNHVHLGVHALGCG